MLDEPTLTSASCLVPATPTTTICPPTSATRACGPTSLAGLTATRKWLPPKWFYDKVGSELFEDITRLPEYYPTRTERAILTEHAAEMVEAAGTDTLIELGSGSSEKTRLLLDALLARAPRRRRPTSRWTSARTRCGPPAPDWSRRTRGSGSARCAPTSPTSWTCCRAAGPRTVAFLGGTIGNFEPAERAAFLRSLRAELDPAIISCSAPTW